MEPGALWVLSGDVPNQRARKSFFMITAHVQTAACDRRAPAWPLTTRLEFHALPSAVACARGHVRSVAREWDLSGLADTAELLTSELVTNAVRASDHLKRRADLAAVPVVRLSVLSDRVSLLICVWDGNEGMPVRKDAGVDSESGRGLMLVESLSEEWGVYREASGKVIWVLISLPGDL
jgi:anti-sigma regulatory factor (Ser/Thr protein kinase)